MKQSDEQSNTPSNKQLDEQLNEQLNEQLDEQLDEQIRTKVIGLTGGIGSGKSTVAALLKERGVEIIDADQISRLLVSTKGPLIDELASALGNGILDEDGNFDRKKTANLVFKDSDALVKLNTILHKHISTEIKRNIETLNQEPNQKPNQKQKEEGIRIIALDVPLPVKVGFLDLCNEVWVVTADEDVRIDRLMETRGYSRKECLQRMENQPSGQEYLALAEVVIDNNGTETELTRKVDGLIQKLADTPAFSGN